MAPPRDLDAVVAELERRRHCAVVRTHQADRVGPCVDAYIRGGLTVVEITTTCPDWPGHIRTLAARSSDALLVGCGTVLTAEDARVAVDAGAAFLVSPVLDDAVVAAARELGVLFVPGCATPSEMAAAHRLGCRMQKLFPEVHGGPKWVKSAMGALPFLRIVPTAGVTAENAADYIAAGAACVGAGNSFLAPAELQDAGDWAEVEARARRFSAAVQPFVESGAQ